MAISLEKVTNQSTPTNKVKSLLDIVLERKEQRYKKSKKKSLRPWQNFNDQVADDRYYKKKSTVMKPFNEAQLSDDEKLEIQIAHRANTLFTHLKKDHL
ncbi:hypothetical protein M899_2688 [Bacteriovorax sp. BSW11_IV]|uniref:hypothetical protein n=1 Tax=Bacteriovorax sp. BSW11_IV TaxID=1353529 RepID=UPI00038A44E2|nr:hypothetical protein [Bacteriovorax sp. BSW11_IV]EQC49089.1 hypothetical protein M899_2688 [Bacteriovorax sp. BSW11_IV]